MSENLLLRYANYNKWANQRITNAIVSAGEAAADIISMIHSTPG